jgi:catechol 2,3-dioxygenase-like lactoylglutathione lyase family enzyme
MTTSMSSTSASIAEPAVRPADRLGRLAGVVVGVPDPDASARFLAEAIGLHVDGAGVAWCAGDYGPHGQAAIALEPAPELTLSELIFEVSTSYDLEALGARLAAAGIDADRRDDGALAFADPGGIPIACAPGAERRAAEPPFDPLRPRRLGHVNLKEPDPPAAARFYQDVLGLRLSEQIGDGLYFLRIATEHHNVGLRGGARGELHHLGLEVAGWQVYQPVLDRLSELGYAVEYGPGRHRPGNNLFAYLVDPASGLRVELFADMAHIPDEDAHEPVRWEAGDRMTKTINRWGPTPPASFLE